MWSVACASAPPTPLDAQVRRRSPSCLMTEPDDPVAHPFFKRDATIGAIERLSEEPRLTIIVGAGSSAEAGFPTWRQLVESMLAELGESCDLPADSDRATRDGIG